MADGSSGGLLGFGFRACSACRLQQAAQVSAPGLLKGESEVAGALQKPRLNMRGL